MSPGPSRNVQSFSAASETARSAASGQSWRRLTTPSTKMIPAARTDRSSASRVNRVTAARSLEVLPNEPELDGVLPLAVPFVGPTLDALAHEPRALGVRDRPRVVAVARELEP